MANKAWLKNSPSGHAEAPVPTLDMLLTGHGSPQFGSLLCDEPLAAHSSEGKFGHPRRGAGILKSHKPQEQSAL